MFWIVEELRPSIPPKKVQAYFFEFLRLINQADGFGLLQLEQELMDDEALYLTVWRILTSEQKSAVRHLIRDTVRGLSESINRV